MSGSKKTSKKSSSASERKTAKPSPGKAAPPENQDARTTASEKPGSGANDGMRQAMRSTNWLLWITVGLVLFVTISGINRAIAPPTKEHQLFIPALEEEQVDLPGPLRDRGLPLAEVHQQLRGANLPKPLVHVALYADGRWEGDAWGDESGLKGSIKEAFEEAQAASKRPPTAAVLVVATDQSRVKPDSTGSHFSNVHRGMRGVVIQSDTETYRISPTLTIAANRSIRDELKDAAKERNTSVRKWLEGSKAYSFATRQFVIDLSEGGKATETLRGNRFIRPEEVTQQAVAQFEGLLTDWMLDNLREDGRLTYMYYPSSGRESKSNNMIRQWMGTVAMGRAAKIHPELGADQRVEKNIEYNLAHFYKENDRLGWIEYEGNAKLGAAALSLISLIESPAREKFQRQEAALFRLTNHLWTDSGKFYCFYLPESRKDDNLHNFYPGETLLSWSFLYAQNKDPEILKRSMQSFRYYKEWHLENRNPAFIPWHTQAYYNLWKETKDQALVDWIFEMNDWLVDVMQTNSRVAYDDTIGRFYDPISGRYGVPHASSTGVYLEGLIDAFALARSLGDDKHMKKYREAILLGLRSAMQLQFQDDIDMFYVTNRDRLQGGIRTTVYDNAVRVDNVQHILMGVQKIIREFQPEDYRR